MKYRINQHKTQLSAVAIWLLILMEVVSALIIWVTQLENFIGGFGK